MDTTLGKVVISRDVMIEIHNSDTISAESPMEETLERNHFTKPTSNDATEVSNSNDESSLPKNDSVFPGPALNEQLPIPLQTAVSDADTPLSAGELLQR